jgi:hypothetical protein
VALENLTAHREPVELPATREARSRQADTWRAWLDAKSLAEAGSGADRTDRQ